MVIYYQDFENPHEKIQKSFKKAVKRSRKKFKLLLNYGMCGPGTMKLWQHPTNSKRKKTVCQKVGSESMHGGREIAHSREAGAALIHRRVCATGKRGSH